MTDGDTSSLDIEPAPEPITNPVEKPAAAGDEPASSRRRCRISRLPSEPRGQGVPELRCRVRRTVRLSFRSVATPRSAGGASGFEVPELVPIRYGRMLVSPFAFYRGGALDHGVGSGADAELGASASSCAAMRICRTSASSARRSGAWCSTSTTSTRPAPGPWEWDVKRLAASFAIGGPRKRLLGQGAAQDRAFGHGALVPGGDRRFRGHEQPGCLVLEPAR